MILFGPKILCILLRHLLKYVCNIKSKDHSCIQKPCLGPTQKTGRIFDLKSLNVSQLFFLSLFGIMEIENYSYKRKLLNQGQSFTPHFIQCFSNATKGLNRIMQTYYGKIFFRYCFFLSTFSNRFESLFS